MASNSTANQCGTRIELQPCARARAPCCAMTRARAGIISWLLASRSHGGPGGARGPGPRRQLRSRRRMICLRRLAAPAPFSAATACSALNTPRAVSGAGACSIRCAARPRPAAQLVLHGYANTLCMPQDPTDWEQVPGGCSGRSLADHISLICSGHAHGRLAPWHGAVRASSAFGDERSGAAQPSAPFP